MHTHRSAPHRRIRAVVLAVTLKGERARWPLAELLPHAFGPSDLP